MAVAIPFPKRIAKDTRRQMEAAIEQHLTAVDGLLALLDLFAGDTDLEPSLGSLMGYGGGITDQRDWAWSETRDREADVQDQPHDAEPDEPSLGSLNCVGPIVAGAPAPGFDQRRWALGESNDLEEDHDGREPPGLDE